MVIVVSKRFVTTCCNFSRLDIVPSAYGATRVSYYRHLPLLGVSLLFLLRRKTVLCYRNVSAKLCNSLYKQSVALSGEHTANIGRILIY